MLSMKGLAWVTQYVRLSVLSANCLCIFVSCLRAQEVSEKLERDDRVGICTHFSQNWPVAEIMPLIAKSGSGWIRDDLNWADLERQPGKYQIPLKAKAWMQTARQLGLKIDLILAYGNPAYPDRYDTAAYAKAAGWLAKEVANDVQAIEILNEPNNFGFRDLYKGAWNGNEAKGAVSPYLRKYVEILNAAAKEIKLANPQMLVIGLGTPPPASFRMIALGLAPQVDGLTDHPYGGRLPELILYPANAAILQRDGIATADAEGTFSSQVSMFRAQARKFGATEKLWHTEWGYATMPPKPDKPVMTEETQAAYILRRLLESEAAGVEHTFIYDFRDDGENFGLIRNDRSPKQSYFALQRITRFLAGTALVAPAKQAMLKTDTAVQPPGLGNRCYTFASSDGPKLVIAYWAAEPWVGNGISQNAEITLPELKDPRQVLAYDLLSGKQSEIPWKRFDESHILIKASISGAPKLLIVRL